MGSLWVTLTLALSISSILGGGPKFRRNENSTIYTKSNPFEIFEDRPPECPPCFNCFLPAYKCLNSGECNQFDGRCKCPPGFGGDNCDTPVCGSLPSEERPPRKGDTCECDDGWSGINCNVCVEDTTCNQMVPPGLNGTCYKGGLVVQENHQMCDVTNKKIIEMLPDRKPQVTFSCNREKEECGFQFWVAQVQSFYCELKNCTFTNKLDYDGKNRNYKCESVSCECIPGKMLCGEEGSIDISDFLTEEIKGPGDFRCSGNACSFEEPAMNELILSVFGDSSITIDCKSGECLYHSQIPGVPIDKKPSYKVFMIVAFSTISVFFIVLGIWLYNVSKSKKDSGYVPVDFDDEADKLMSHHVPSTLVFEDVSYSVGEKLILYNITGIVQPGEMMAIMGASGAGKTSFLDILARRNKTGDVNGTFYVNGKSIGDREFRKVVGYVDQEDTLMPTLTVFETIMTSALLRLPREMSYEAKKGRVMETMSELGILGIKDCRIGNSAARGISGGEKRRVSIACELVTSPSILFLDEPTSGLDAYNAYNVIESLKTLAVDYKRTIIFTIHQPRSNIYTMFDKLLLLASGNMVYSGPANFTTDYLDSIDHPCPAGFNVADYLLDWTQEPQSRYSESGRAHLLTGISSMPSIGLGNSTLEGDLESQSEPNVWGDASDGPSRMITNEPESIPTVSNSIPEDEDYLSKLVKLFKESDLYTDMITSIEGIKAQDNEDAQSTHSSIGRGYKRSSWFTQFKILSARTFKNLYRDPLLMLANYCMSVLLGLLCGILYFHTTDDISGFQNRMGVFFFMCALFGFSCLTSLQVFQPERILFMRERANGYYAPITYFSSKIIFDIIPLRLIPPVLMGIIVYPMVGLNPGVVPFFKFLLILILFNLTASSVVFLIGILVSDLSLSNLICSLIMLFNMLFSGLFLNKTSIPPYLKWLKEFSFFNFALESMLVNELKYMQLKDNKFGLIIDIPGASILSSFGFDASAFWPDTIKLGVMFIVMIILSFISLQLFVKEKR